MYTKRTEPYTSKYFFNLYRASEPLTEVAIGSTPRVRTSRVGRGFEKGEDPERLVTHRKDKGPNGGAWWLIGRFVAFRPKDRGFEPHSSRHVWALGKSLTVA